MTVKKNPGNGCTVRCLILFAWIPQEIDESWSELPTLFFNHDWHSGSAHNRVSTCNFLEDKNLCCFRKSSRTRFTDILLRRAQFKTCNIAFYSQLLVTLRPGWMLCYLKQVHVTIRNMTLGSTQFRTEMSTRNTVCNILGISPGSDAGEIPKRLHTIFKTRQKFEIKSTRNIS